MASGSPLTEPALAAQVLLIVPFEASPCAVVRQQFHNALFDGDEGVPESPNQILLKRLPVSAGKRLGSAQG